MTASRFRDARHLCSLTIPAAAKLLRVTERTVQNWESGRARVPYAAFKLMRILRGHELPHPAWRGFRVVGDTLWTPEGRSFRPDHMAWWSLTCRMADEFRALVRLARPVVPSPQVDATSAVGGLASRLRLLQPASPVVPSANRGLKYSHLMQSDASLHQEARA